MNLEFECKGTLFGNILQISCVIQNKYLILQFEKNKRLRMAKKESCFRIIF